MRILYFIHSRFTCKALPGKGSLSDENKAKMDNILRLFLDRFDGKDGSFSFGTIKQHHITNVECEDKCVNEPGGTSQVAMSVFHQLSTTNNPWPGIA